MTAFEISVAYVADLIFGDPHSYPHPVKLIGKSIHFLEVKFLQWRCSSFEQRLLGFILAVFIFIGTGTMTWAMIWVAGWVHPVLSIVVTIFFAYTTLATKNLSDEVKKIIKALEQGDLTRARKEVKFLVSRDTDRLDEKGICRALIETVAENTSDGIVAPLFYLVIGGPPLAMVYKAINTLDSMVGYKNERYRYFGWASAKADDWVNFIPARLTAILFILSSLILGKSWKGAWKVTRRDARNNLSPNSGYPEAAVAGALGIQLGGEDFYFGKPQKKPLIGEAQKPIGLQEVKEPLHLMLVTSLIAVLIAISVTLFN